jgi:transposase
VAESYERGAVVSEVARRYDISAQHLFAWRKAARAGLLTLRADQAPLFVPIGGESMTIEIGGAIIRWRGSRVVG